MDDASLDDFLDADSGETADSEATDSGADDDTTEAEKSTDTETDADHSDQPTDPSSPRVEPAHVDPATVTSRWDGEGVLCSSCGTRVERAWESPDGVVCPSCKEWS
jgi:hypothetical protein